MGVPGHLVLRNSRRKGLTTRGVVQWRCGGSNLIEMIERQRFLSALKRSNVEMGGRDDVGTAAETIFLRTRGGRLSRIRRHPELSFRRYHLSNLRAVCRLRSDRRNRRSVIVALAKTRHAEIR